MWKNSRFLFLYVLINPLAVLWADNGLIEQCLARASGQSAVCEQAAQSIASNQQLLDHFGRQLEGQMRFSQAVTVYEIGTKQHSHSKLLLRSLIRARAAWRMQKKFSNIGNTQAVANKQIKIKPQVDNINMTSVKRPIKQSSLVSAASKLQSKGNSGIDINALAVKYENKSFENQTNVQPSSVSQNNQISLEKKSILTTPKSLPSTPTTKVKDESRLRSKLASVSRGKSYALVIGNNDYQAHDFPDLMTAENDAKQIATVLEKKYGFKTKLMLNADRYATMAAISSLRKSASSEDKVLIYYAGHGVLDEKTNRGYWLPVDAEPDNIANWISASDVTDVLTGMAAHHAIVIADSCFSGSLLRNGVNTKLDERNALLQRLNSKKSRTVLTSGGLEPVQDDGGGEHSVFANILIDILERNTSVLEVERLFIQLRDRVILRADQTPQYAPIRKAGHDGGDFIFVPI